MTDDLEYLKSKCDMLERQLKEQKQLNENNEKKSLNVDMIVITFTVAFLYVYFISSNETVVFLQTEPQTIDVIMHILMQSFSAIASGAVMSALFFIAKGVVTVAIENYFSIKFFVLICVIIIIGLITWGAF